MKARDIMTSNPEAITPDEPISRAARMMRSIGIGAVPVVEDRSTMHLVGILTDRDLAMRHIAEGHTEDCPVRHAMTKREDTRNFFTVRPEDTVVYVVELMSEHQVRRIPVVDDTDRRLVGIIALADVAREIGPRDPAEVVRLLEAISEPAEDRTPAPAR
jgi:CBS domain-containing protein